MKIANLLAACTCLVLRQAKGLFFHGLRPDGLARKKLGIHFDFSIPHKSVGPRGVDIPGGSTHILAAFLSGSLRAPITGLNFLESNHVGGLTHSKNLFGKGIFGSQSVNRSQKLLIVTAKFR